MRLVRLVLIAILLTGMSNIVLAEDDHQYVGVKKCSMCHKSATKGNQHGQWLSSNHANAYNSLATAEAKEAALANGVTGDPQEAEECLKCHVTGFGVDQTLLGSGFKKEDGVQCETCHGAGGDYWSMSVMKSREQAIAAGLIIPDETLCRSCHNEESPNFQGFDYEEYHKQIEHPKP